MKLSMHLTFRLKQQSNGTWVGLCDQIPMIIADRSPERTLERCDAAATGVLNHLGEDAPAYLRSRGVHFIESVN